MNVRNKFRKDDLTSYGEIVELSLDQLGELSGGRMHPRAGGNGGPLIWAIGAFEVGFLVGTEISKIPPVRTGLESAGDAVGTWLGNNGIWW
jgi:hypothetical protein